MSELERIIAKLVTPQSLELDWTSAKLATLLFFCSFAVLLGAICAAYSYRVDEVSTARAFSSRVRGLISLIVALALLAGAIGYFTDLIELPKYFTGEI